MKPIRASRLTFRRDVTNALGAFVLIFWMCWHFGWFELLKYYSKVNFVCLLKCLQAFIVGKITYQVLGSRKFYEILIDPLKPNDPYRGRTATLTSKLFILYIYSTNIGTEYFKRGINCPFFSLQSAVCFIILAYLVPVLFTLYIQVC